MQIFIKAIGSKQRFSLCMIILAMLALSSCGINPASSIGQESLHNNIATGIGNTPEPGNILKPFIPTNGHYESLLTANGNIYIGSDNGSVYALQSSSGKLLWHYNTGNFVYVFAVMNGNIYLYTHEGIVYALKASDGSLLWQHDSNHST